MKNSQKRQKILEIFKNGDLLTANIVCEKLPDIDRATVYRNLSLFVEEGILREVNVKKGISSYELQKENDHHQHFICTDCEKVIPVDVNESALQKLAPKGVKLQEIELNLKGQCEDCK